MLYQNITGADALGNDIRCYHNMGFPSPHMHRSAELLFVQHGRVRLTVNGREEILADGDCALVLPYQLHSFEVEGETLLWVHVFEQRGAPMFFSALGTRRPAASRFCADAAALRYYRAACLICPESLEAKACVPSDAMGKLSPMKLKSALYAVLSDYLSGAELIEGEKAEDSLYSRIMMYITEHFAEDITLSSVAAEFGYEPHYLSRYMAKITDIHFRRLVNRCRIDHARHLLESTSADVTEIALASGYGCMRTFHRVFREIVGMSPGEYRKMSGRN